MEEEIWDDIPGFEEYYQVSNLGNVRGVERTIYMDSEKREYVRVVPEHIMAIQQTKGNWLLVALSKDGKGKDIVLDRIVARVFVKNKHGFHYVKHIDGNPLNCKASNLEWVPFKPKHSSDK